jgi:hypothetical protein
MEVVPHWREVNVPQLPLNNCNSGAEILLGLFFLKVIVCDVFTATKLNHVS